MKEGRIQCHGLSEGCGVGGANSVITGDWSFGCTQLNHPSTSESVRLFGHQTSSSPSSLLLEDVFLSLSYKYYSSFHLPLTYQSSTSPLTLPLWTFLFTHATFPDVILIKPGLHMHVWKGPRKRCYINTIYNNWYKGQKGTAGLPPTSISLRPSQ